MSKVVSFDVFDTLLTRNVGSPHHIFLLTGIRIEERFELGIEPEVFANARALAEQEVSRREHPACDIYAIYRQLADTLDIPAGLSEQMAEVELEVEGEESTAVEKHVRLVEQLRSEGHQIVYISDMYLGEPIIRRLLTAHGICREGEPIYVSCEHGASKASGKLFEVVCRELEIAPGQLHHYGNSMSSDIKGAQKAGISATHLPEGNLNRYEQYLSRAEERYRLSVEQTLLYSRMAAASRLSRLQRNGEKEEIYTVASAVAAPILYRFVAHVLERAAGKRIYFLARDGHIMYQIAERIIRARGCQADIRYLYISREALVLAGFDVLEPDDYLEYIIEIFGNESLRVVFKKLSVSDSSMRSMKLGNRQLSKLIAEFDKEHLKTIISHKSVYRDIKEDSEKRKDRLFAYLQSEGVLNSDGRVIVDVGWGLTIQNLMADLFSVEGISPSEGFYFGINESAGSSIQRGKKNGFLWDQRKDKSFEPPHKIIRIFEVFCSAPHGQTIDFSIEDDGIKPVFNSHEARHLGEWGLMDMQQGILNTVEQVLQLQREYQPSNIDDQILMELVKMFWLHPSQDEIRIWGKYPYSIIKHEQRVVNLFQKEPFPKLILHILKKGKLPNSSLDHWPRAYLNSLSPVKRMALTNTLKAKRTLSSFKNDLAAQLSSKTFQSYFQRVVSSSKIKS